MSTDVHSILQKAADQRLSKWQRTLTRGDFFYRTLSITFNEQLIEVALYCAVTAELDDNSITVKCFSAHNASGETVTMHKASAQCKLSEEQFLAAAKKGWQQ